MHNNNAVPSQQPIILLQQQCAYATSSRFISDIRQRRRSSLYVEFRTKRRRPSPIRIPSSLLWVRLLLLPLLLQSLLYGDWNHVIPQLTVVKAQSSTTEVKLIPFQILYITTNLDNDVAVSTGPQPNEETEVDEMQVLAITRQHLIQYEFIHHRNFVTLKLYQTVRMSTSSSSSTETNTNDDNNNNNGTLLMAYTGTVTYNIDNNDDEDDTTYSIHSDMMYMSFLGTNGTIYIQTLQQQAKWISLQNIEIMSMMGHHIYMNENGTTTTTTTDDINNNYKNDDNNTEIIDSSSSSSEEMNPNMQTYIYLIAVGIPMIIILLCGLYYILYLCKYNIQWKQSDYTIEYDIRHIYNNNNNKKKKKKQQTKTNKKHPMSVIQVQTTTNHSSSRTSQKRNITSNNNNIESNNILRPTSSRRSTMDFTNIHDPTTTTTDTTNNTIIKDDDDHNNYVIGGDSDELTFDNDEEEGNNSNNYMNLPTISSSSSSSTCNIEEAIEYDGITPPIIVVQKQKEKSKRSRVIQRSFILPLPSSVIQRNIGIDSDKNNIVITTNNAEDNNNNNNNRMINSTMTTKATITTTTTTTIQSNNTNNSTECNTKSQKHERKTVRPRKYLVEV